MINGGFYSQNIPPNPKYNSFQTSMISHNYQPKHASNNTPLPLIPAEIGKSFSTQLKQLQLIENQLQKSKEVSQQLPQLDTIPIEERSNEESSRVLGECHQKKAMHEQKTDENLKEKFNAMKSMKTILNNVNTSNVKAPISENYSNPKAFKGNMTESLSLICNSIKSDLNLEKNKSAYLLEEIKKSMVEMKSSLSTQLNNYGSLSNDCLNQIQKVMLKGKNKRLKYLARKFFPNGEMDKEIEEEEKREEEERKKKNQLRRMSVLFDQNNAAMLEARKQNEEKELHIKLHEISNYSSDSDNPSNPNTGLDFRKLYHREDMKLLRGVTTVILQNANSYVEMRPLNKFRSYVHFLIAAKRILNIQYLIYSRIKFDAVHFFIDNYEDMDIIIKKLMYNSIKPVIIEILHNPKLDINIAMKKPNAHDLFLVLKRIFERMIEGLSKDFFQGISDNMLSFLSLFLSNYSYIPRDFFSTFELLRFRTTKTGELIEMERDQQRMILGFYLIIKVLLKNIFLELCFNPKSINSLERRVKLNIKMIVTVLYRGIIEEFKKCQTQRNIDEIEDEDDPLNYCQIAYPQKQFFFDVRVVRKRLKIKKLHLNDTKVHQINDIDTYTDKLPVVSKAKKKKGKNKKKQENFDDNKIIEPKPAKKIKKKRAPMVDSGTGNQNAMLGNMEQRVVKPIKLLPELKEEIQQEEGNSGENSINNSPNEIQNSKAKPKKSTLTEQIKSIHQKRKPIGEERQAPRIPPQNANLPPLNSSNQYSNTKRPVTARKIKDSTPSKKKTKKKELGEKGTLKANQWILIK